MFFASNIGYKQNQKAIDYYVCLFRENMSGSIYDEILISRIPEDAAYPFCMAQPPNSIKYK